jgi:ABC-type glutathione transport system ATPase component
MPLLDVCNLVKRYERRSWRGAVRTTEAVSSVSFSVHAGQTFGLVGESGSGKTTTARCLLRLVEPTSGEVRFDGEDVLAYDRKTLRRWRRKVQLVFQDPFASLDPRMRVGRIVREPLDIHAVGDVDAREARVREVLSLVGLSVDLANRYPAALSGGQRQRVAIARALALAPTLLVADEPVSALDVSVQAQVVNLLVDLQRALGLTCVFISHDLRLVRHVCTTVAVMYRGRIVESGPVAAVFDSPYHAYTRALLSASLLPDPDATRVPVAFDAATFDPHVPLTAIGEGHWAAVEA